MSIRDTCFVDMPFGKKPDLSSGVDIDFDQVYQRSIEPAILEVGLDPIRGDHERTGGIIHIPMFGRLLLSAYVVADLTLANPNVFYELGIRHTAKPYTTVPIFAAIRPIPFDISLVRALPYSLEDGKLTDAAASTLKAELVARLRQAIRGAASHDSPIFQLIPNFPCITLPRGITQIFQDEVRQADEFRKQLADARALRSNEERCAALLPIWQSLGDVTTAQGEVLIDLMLSFRDVSGWDEMVRLSDEFSDSLKSNVIVRQQRAFALNRRKRPGDREEAIRILEGLLKEKGADSETLGLLGRIHKDRYRELNSEGSILAFGALDEAIDAYTRGFESDPRDYFPGVNAITLLVEKGDADSLKQIDRLMPLVTFAVERQGGLSSSDYWDRATVLELSVVRKEWNTMVQALPKVLIAAKASWMVGTTRDNLLILQSAREMAGETSPQLNQAIEQFQKVHDALRGTEAKSATA